MDSHDETTESRSETGPWATGTPVDRTETGTLASASSARITGSASAITSAGVR